MVPFWRAPYGEQNSTLRRWAQEAGYQHVSWTSDPERRKTLDSLDWVADPSLRIYCSAEAVRDRILGYGEEANGGIVLMHLGTSRTHDRVHERLGEIIDGLRGNGYRMVKVSELLESREDEGEIVISLRERNCAALLPPRSSSPDPACGPGCSGSPATPDRADRGDPARSTPRFAFHPYR